MGWKYRNGRAYYYKSERVGGRIKSTYFGSGLAAVAVAMMDQEARDEREAEEAASRAERRRLDAEEEAVPAMFDRIQTVADAALMAAGYHRHKRGEWRRTRT